MIEALKKEITQTTKDGFTMLCSFPQHWQSQAGASIDAVNVGSVTTRSLEMVFGVECAGGP